MTKFLYVYHGGSMPQSEEEGAKVMKAWTDWFAGLGAAVVDGGAPVGKSQTVSPGGSVANDGGANPASGYSVIDAKDPADAERIAKGCPILDAGGSIEVAPIIQM
ncbi:YciI family protein [Aminobacter sp. Piv2-1]|uniref:YciI family protein n=1 Tax=Aminobacter sp. Piv2-1 TaxID=3031122 RepID=UPI0030B2D857